MTASEPTSDKTDQELVQEVKDGEDAALHALVQRHLPSIYTFCLRYMGNAEEAQDAAQETFLKAWRNLGRYNPAKSFRTWLFAIAKNTATDLMRKRRSIAFSRFDTNEDGNVLTDTLADPEPLPEELFARATLADEVRGALTHLKPQDRAILSMRYEEELSFEDIAKILKMSPNTVRSLHRRALITLRKHLPDPNA